MFIDRVSRGILTLTRGLAEKGSLIVFEPISVGQENLFREMLSMTHLLKYSHERLRDLDPAWTATIPLQVETLGEGGIRYSHDLGYTYQVDGQVYQGNRQRWFDAETREEPSELDWALRANPVGKEVTVHYDPKHPATSVLDPRDSGGIGFALGQVLSTGAIVAGMVALYLLFG